MAINIISANLNEWGDAGRFEADQSTWGFGSIVNGINISRSNNSDRSFTAPQGFNVCRAFSFSVVNGPQVIGRARAQLKANSKYIVTAKVRCGISGLSDTMGSAGDQVRIDNEERRLNVPGFTNVVWTDTTVGTAATDWVEIKMDFHTDANYVPQDSSNFNIYIFNSGTAAFRYAYVDEFYIYEYDEFVNPCTIDGTATPTNATGAAIADGYITVNITSGNAPYEYSRNNGASWQSSNVFTGLAPGVYTIIAREVNRTTCTKTFVVTVNFTTVGFDFTFTKQDETISGALDGRIEITPTVAAAYDFSKDGTTFQASNIFENLAPGNYNVVVRRVSDGALVGKLITIAQGTVLFERIWFARNPVFFERQAASGWQNLTNYRLYNDVRVERTTGTSVYSSLVKLQRYPDEFGKGIFRMELPLQSVLAATPPAFNVQAIQRLTDRVKLFKHFTGDMENNQQVPTEALTESLPHLVLLGGVSKYSYGTEDFFTDTLPATKQFMTWAPLQKTVDRTQEDYLTFFVYSPLITAIKINATAYFDDGTSASATLLTQSGVSYGQLYQLPAGPGNLGVGTINAAKNMVRYEVRLLNQSDASITETRTYNISGFKVPRTRYVMFLNALGGFEVLRFTGVVEYASVIDKETLTRYLGESYNAQDGETVMATVTRRQQINYSTGFFEDATAAAWLDYMNDLLMSRQVYDVTTGVRVPINISAGTYQMQRDNDYERFVRFTALPAYTDENYSPQ